ncbi:hypothetical protein [Priestia koreensis]|uniref:Uncharacterized protein n=1 Tax=Priestia koreensis TaxID=284581 RepID=A0A0M0L8Y4_9BACI|nr:hypothetical protein [Priestia koreensis]KOO47128.1 hypothetical protein AMD01_07175 [Priestia koreensis]MCM3004731.1 hypothetical protein [Priestia koreensis]
MNMCPLCNGFSTVYYVCSTCGSEEKDLGRVADYLDDYSAYVEFDVSDQMMNQKGHYCSHMFYCETCGNEEVQSIQA